MIADAHPSITPHRPHQVLETDDGFFGSAAEFIEALDKYYARRATQTKRHYAPSSQFPSATAISEYPIAPAMAEFGPV